MGNEIKKVYPSKVGLGLLAIVVVGFGVGLYYTVAQAQWLHLVIQAFILILVVLLFYSISYEIDDKTLVVKIFFWFKKQIPIESITHISETYNPISSPAASLDRLEILYGKYNSIIISPKDRKGFIAHLKSINPDLELKLRKSKN